VRARVVLMLAATSLCAGCGNALPLAEQNRVGVAWDRVVLTCDGSSPTTPARLRRARDALDVLLDQYAATPWGAAQIVDSDGPEPLTSIVEGIARTSPPWLPECRELSRRAEARLRLQGVIDALPASGGDPARPLRAPRVAEITAPKTTRASFSSGVVRRVPLIGTLSWSCDRHARQFYTRLTLARPGATLFIRLNSDGFRLYDHKQIDPRPGSAATTVTGPLAARGQSWRIRYHHEPATILFKAHVRLARSGPRCVNWRDAVHRTAH
jgi:hypothetical protein